MPIDEPFILGSLPAFERLGTSTNTLYRFSAGNSRYILKINHEPSGGLSPFWWGIKEIFGSTFDTQRENIEVTLRLLENPHIPTARLVLKSHRHKFQVFLEAQGVSHAPDTFPDSVSLGFQLGQFIGCIHSRQYDYFGRQGLQFRCGIKEKMLRAMSVIIQKHWADRKDVRAWFQKMQDVDISPATYSLIMPDISGNQFVYGEGLESIRAVVDYDAYVIGPREWELAVIEMCRPHCEAFQKGYEQYAPFPDLRGTREFYRFFMYLCDPWENQDLACFMSRDVRF